MSSPDEERSATVRGLRIRWAGADGRAVERRLDAGSLTIGRGSGCDLVFQDPTLSRSHARLDVRDDVVTVVDLGSRNGTLVNGESVASAELRHGDRVTVGNQTLEFLTQADAPTSVAISADGIVSAESRAGRATEVMAAMPTDESEPANALTRLLRSPVVSERELRAAGLDVSINDVLPLGGGLGSFVFVDALRVSGMRPDQIAVVGNDALPFSKYQRFCANSQIPPHERLRSNSDSCPDNLWGFPGYAVREMWGCLRRGDFSTFGSVLWSIFGESAIADTYTPRSGDVFTNVAREADRIGWGRMLQYGRVRTIRKTSEGRIVAIVTTDQRGHDPRRLAVSARFVHIALGYPAIQLLPDLAEYRERTGDRVHVVNAYEPHDAIYHALRAKGGTVMLRGRGIVASRILQRLHEERRHNPDIKVVHLHRSHLQAGRSYGWSRRKVDGEFEFQAFNWPKGCWTGPQRYALESASPDERKHLLDLWGGTTTANRRDWRAIVRRGLGEGWYRHEYGIVEMVSRVDDQRVRVRIDRSSSTGGSLELTADYIIDCTGLVASPERAPVLGDLIKTYGLERNPLGRFHVTKDFEIPAMRHGDARMFAAGATTLGGPFATVDSFLGLQYAGLRAVNAMADEAPTKLHRLSGTYSMGQWLRWARGQEP